MKPRLILFAVAVLMLAACNKQQLGLSQGQPFPATEPQSVEVLMSFPSRPHVKIGSISVPEYQPGPGGPTLEDAREMLQEAGAALGAHAVVVVSTPDDRKRQRRVQGEAIRWTD